MSNDLLKRSHATCDCHLKSTCCRCPSFYLRPSP